jgi:hypothetical protein
MHWCGLWSRGLRYGGKQLMYEDGGGQEGWDTIGEGEGS